MALRFESLAILQVDSLYPTTSSTVLLVVLVLVVVLPVLLPVVLQNLTLNHFKFNLNLNCMPVVTSLRFELLFEVKFKLSLATGIKFKFKLVPVDVTSNTTEAGGGFSSLSTTTTSSITSSKESEKLLAPLAVSSTSKSTTTTLIVLPVELIDTSINQIETP